MGLISKVKSIMGSESTETRPETTYECQICGATYVNPRGTCGDCGNPDVEAVE